MQNSWSFFTSIWSHFFITYKYIIKFKGGVIVETWKKPHSLHAWSSFCSSDASSHNNLLRSMTGTCCKVVFDTVIGSWFGWRYCSGISVMFFFASSWTEGTNNEVPNFDIFLQLWMVQNGLDWTQFDYISLLEIASSVLAFSSCMLPHKQLTHHDTNSFFFFFWFIMIPTLIKPNVITFFQGNIFIFINCLNIHLICSYLL